MFSYSCSIYERHYKQFQTQFNRISCKRQSVVSCVFSALRYFPLFLKISRIRRQCYAFERKRRNDELGVA